MDLIKRKVEEETMAKVEQKYNFGHKDTAVLEKSMWEHYDEMNTLMAKWRGCDHLSKERVACWEKYVKVRDVFEALKQEVLMRKNTQIN